MEFDDEVAHLIVERRPVGARNGHVLIEPQLHVVALQALSPGSFPIGIGSRRSVTKEIQMDGATSGQNKTQGSPRQRAAWPV